jgi:hypothetical protein
MERYKLDDNQFVGDEFMITDVSSLMQVVKNWSLAEKSYFDRFPEEVRECYPQFFRRVEKEGYIQERERNESA